MQQKLSVLVLLMVMTVIPLHNRVEAQEVETRLEKKRVALVVGAGVDQTLNLYFNLDRGSPSAAILPESQLPTIIVTIQPGEITPGGAPCTQTVRVQTNVTPGLMNTVSLGIWSGEEEREFLVNGVVEEVLDGCFDEANRVVYEVAGLHVVESEDPRPGGSVNDFGGGLFIYDVTDPDGGKAASGPAGVFTIDASFRNSIVALGLGEGAEIYHYRRQPSQELPQEPVFGPGDTAAFVIHVTNTGDATCTQGIHIEGLELSHEGLAVHRISKAFGSISYGDGDPVELEDPCFKDSESQRVVIEVSVRHPNGLFGISETGSPLTTMFPAGFPHFRVLGHSIYDVQTGATKSTDAISFFDSSGSETSSYP